MLWGLLVVVCSLLLLAVALPIALATMGALAQWAWSSGFLAFLGVCVLAVAVLVLLDPRERRHR